MLRIPALGRLARRGATAALLVVGTVGADAARADCVIVGSDVTCSAELRAQGVELTELDEATRAAFAAATRPQVDLTRQSFSPELRALFDKELNAA